MSKASQATYYDLVIVAESPDTEIWLGDDEGYFVQKETGTLSSSLLPDMYIVKFGLGTPQYEIDLSADSHYSERTLAAGAYTPRHIPQFPKQSLVCNIPCPVPLFGRVQRQRSIGVRW